MQELCRGVYLPTTSKFGGVGFRVSAPGDSGLN